MTVILDDHLLRDWLARRDQPLQDAVGRDVVATTNLWYVRLCRSAARATGGPRLVGLSPVDRSALIAGLVALPDDIVVAPMARLAWRMGDLAAEHDGLSALGAEAVAAAIELDARLLVSSRDIGPGTRRCCTILGIGYEALAR